MNSGLGDLSGVQQGNSQQTMPNHKWDFRILLRRERHELRRNLSAQHVAVKRDKIRNKEAVENRIQQQRVFKRFTKFFNLLNQQSRLLHSRLRFRRGISFDVHKRGYHRDSQLDLLAAKRRSCCEGLDQVECAIELTYRFDQRRAFQRPLSRLAKKVSGLLGQSSLGAVARKQFRLDFGNVWELTFQRYSDVSVQCAPRLAQQRPVGGILY